jgi:hypothetical protein
VWAQKSRNVSGLVSWVFQLALKKHYAAAVVMLQSHLVEVAQNLPSWSSITSRRWV